MAPSVSAVPRGRLDRRLQVPFIAAWQAGSFRLHPAARNLSAPTVFLSGSVSRGAPDGRFVDMITRLDYRMDDMVAESQSEARREVLTLLLNLSSGVQCSAPANQTQLRTVGREKVKVRPCLDVA